jgi:hypothetical protein
VAYFLIATDIWVAGGGRNAAELYRQLAAQGSTAGYDAVRRFVRRLLGSSGRPGPRPGVAAPAAAPAPTARKLSFEFIGRPGDRKAEELRKESKLTLSEWLAKVERSGVPEMRSFAAGLRRDVAVAGIRHMASQASPSGSRPKAAACSGNVCPYSRRSWARW